jgi:hypothetical protein
MKMISSTELTQIWQKRFIRVAFRRDNYWEPWVDLAVDREAKLCSAMKLNLREQVERKNKHE